MVGHNWDCWINDKLRVTRDKLDLSKDVKPLCDCDIEAYHEHIDLQQQTPIRYLARFDGINLIKWKMDKFLTGWKRVPSVQNKTRLVKNICSCDNLSHIDTNHILICDKYSTLRSKIENEIYISYREMLQ